MKQLLFLLLPLFCGTLLLSAPSARAEDLPPVFSKLTLAKARQEAKDGGKLLIVKATAEWCGPCKAMDKTTWRDEKVVAWVKANAIAIQLNVDDERKDAESLKIRAMPTMIAFKGDNELGRIVGFRNGPDLLTWLEEVKTAKPGGPSPQDKLKAKLAKVRAGELKLKMQDRLALASELAREELNAEATDEFAWLWDNMLQKDPAMLGVRGSFMASDMRRLADAYEPAKKRFTELREIPAKAIEGDAPIPDAPTSALDDWFVLNEVLDDDAASLAWYDKHKDNKSWSELIQRSYFRLEPIFERQGRYADFARTITDPLARLDNEYRELGVIQNQDLPGTTKEQKKELAEFMLTSFRDKTAKLYAGLLACNRESEAGAYAAKAIQLDDTPEMRIALVTQALKADQPREIHKQRLEDAAAKGANITALQAELESKLKK